MSRPNPIMKQISYAFLSLSLAVMLGAFGSHFLKEKITESILNTYKTANLYHFIHGLGWALTYFILISIRSSKANIIGVLFFTGILLFSGSLYLLVLFNWIGWNTGNVVGALTPIGGIILISAWAWAAFEIFHTDKSLFS